MSILINELFGKFAQVPNTIVEDTNISSSAFRLYCYLITKPNGWKVRNNHIKDILKISDGTISKNFKILLNNNYIRRYPIQDKKGKFLGGFNYEIFSFPYEPLNNSKSTNNYKNAISNMEYFQIMYNVEKEKKKKTRTYINKPKNRPYKI